MHCTRLVGSAVSVNPESEEELKRGVLSFWMCAGVFGELISLHLSFPMTVYLRNLLWVKVSSAFRTNAKFVAAVLLVHKRGDVHHLPQHGWNLSTGWFIVEEADTRDISHWTPFHNRGKDSRNSVRKNGGWSPFSHYLHTYLRSTAIAGFLTIITRVQNQSIGTVSPLFAVLWNDNLSLDFPIIHQGFWARRFDEIVLPWKIAQWGFGKYPRLFCFCSMIGGLTQLRRRRQPAFIIPPGGVLSVSKTPAKDLQVGVVCVVKLNVEALRRYGVIYNLIKHCRSNTIS
jgi:hypothetical protein